VIADVWPDIETQRFFQRWVGYCLCGSIKEQVFVFLWGTGANGKSVIVHTIEKLLGSYARKVSSDVFALKQGDERERKTVPLKGKRLVFTDETQKGQTLDEGLIKSIASPDTQSSRLLYGESEDWAPTAKVIIMGNERMHIRGGDYATERRIVFIGCEQRFEGKRCDPDLSDKLEGELPGIMGWALEGHREWKKSGLGVAAKVKADSQEFCEEADALAPFFERHNATSESISRAAFYEAYLTWSKAQGNEHHLSRQSFAGRVRARGYLPGPQRREGSTVDRVWIAPSRNTVTPCNTSLEDFSIGQRQGKESRTGVTGCDGVTGQPGNGEGEVS
jgi:putative DNA primase/helicase